MSQDVPPVNLALSAKASAFEFYGDYRPERANDGNRETRWSGIPGHNVGAWFQLDWDKPAKVAEVVVHQYGTYTEEMDVQVWDAAKNDWRTLQHFGEPGQRLRSIVICRFDPVETTKVRLGNITNGPTFREVEVYAEHFMVTKPEIHVGSDLRGNIVGIVTDQWGAEPILGSVDVRMGGRVDDHRTIATDKYGMFSVPMPVGMKGKVRFEFRPKVEGAAPSAPGGAVTTLDADAADFQYGLTELGYKPKVTLLDGTWKFMGDPPKGFEKPGFDDSKWKDIKVPAHWEMEGFVVRSGHGGYRKRFVLPPPLVASNASDRGRGQGGGGSGPRTKPPTRGATPNLHPQPLPPGHQGEGASRLKIRFDAVYSGCAVYCNGVLVARHTGGATPFEADLTDVAKPGENVLAVDVQEHTVASDHLDKMSIYAYFHLAGIWRSVYLFRVPEVHLQGIEWETKRSATGDDADVAMSVNVSNESGAEVLCAVNATLLSPEGKPVPIVPDRGHSGTLVVPGLILVAKSAGDQIHKYRVSRPKWWTAETPNLYTLRLTLKDEKGKVIQTLTQRVGFRQTTVQGTQIFVNSTPVKFKGTCHHDQNPLKGRAVSAADTRRDLELMKEANLNAVRTSHYPPHPSLPEIADEIGLYVEDEAPFCWADAADDLRNLPLVLQTTAELIARDRNHPSVTWWSVANESSYGWCFWRTLEWLNKADPSRPTSGATSVQPGDEKGHSDAKIDIYSLHNPIATSRIKDAEGKLKAPLIFDESLCIFQGIFNDVAEMWVDPGIRDYYVAPLIQVYKDFMDSKVTQGSFIWCWSDDIFCAPNRGLEYGREATRSHFIESSYQMPGRGLVGDAPWGVVDGWRRKKPEFFHTRKLHSPVKIGEPAKKVQGKFATLTFPVKNEFDFTGIEQCRFVLKCQGKEYPGKGVGGPRSNGTVVVSGVPNEDTFKGYRLLAYAPGNRLVDTYAFEIPRPFVSPVRKKLSALKIWDVGDLSGNSVHIAGEGFELAFSRDGGYLRQCVVGGRPLMLESPAPHLMPSNNPLRPLPDPITWQLKGLEVTRVGDDVHVAIKSDYENMECESTWKIRPDGSVDFTCRTKWTGDQIIARETGIRFGMALACDLFAWERKGEWTDYPADHIGRNYGEARPFENLKQGGKPTWPYAKDYSPMGSNDFRSTKRGVHMFSIGYPADPGGKDAPKLTVLTDGFRAVRAAVNSDRISVHVNTYYGGTNVGWGEWITNYGRGLLVHKGETLVTNCRFWLRP